MTIDSTPPTLQRVSVSTPVRLAAAWTSMMFLYLYVDYLLLYKPDVLDGLRAGVVFDFTISPGLLTTFLAVVGIPALMVFLSVTLPARANRITNLVVGAAYVPVTLFNAVGESWAWAGFYGLSIGLEILLLACILRWAWTWPRADARTGEPSLR